MAPELRKRKSKPAVAELEPVAKKAKATKAAPKTEKRKAPEDASPIAVKKQKPSKDVVSKKAAALAEEKVAPKKSALKKEKQSPKPKGKKEKSKKASEEEEEEIKELEQSELLPSDAEEAEEEEIDDDTKALVKTLDSGDEDDDEADKQVGTYKKGQDVGKIPKAKKATKPSSGSGNPGVMYLGRIPHGFYEHEIRSYFGQFGDITRLRVVRNKKTGASRHRAFIEFADAEVADIAARTMDKYLLFGHILTARVVPPADVHANLFKGANRRFKVVPWNKMAGRQLERPLSESQWQVRISKEEQRRAARAEKLKAMGYEFEAPQLKAAEAKPLLENGAEGEEAAKAIEAPPAVEEDKQVAAPEAEKPEDAKPATEEATPQKKKGKKGKKTKS